MTISIKITTHIPTDPAMPHLNLFLKIVSLMGVKTDTDIHCSTVLKRKCSNKQVIESRLNEL